MIFDLIRKIVRSFKENVTRRNSLKEEKFDELKKKLDYQEKALQKHEEILNQQNEKINKLKKSLVKKTKELKSLAEKIEEQEVVLKELGMKNKRQKKNVTKKCDDASRNAQYSVDIVTEMVRTQNKTCPYKWEIKNFTNKRHRAKSNERFQMYESESFFMLGGYKAQLILYPNGCDDQVNTHVSMFIKMLKGPYDELLRWPMKGCIQLCVLDGTDDEENTLYINTNQQHCQHIFERPCGDENKDWGFSKYIPLADLHKYLVEDTLRVCVTALSINL